MKSSSSPPSSSTSVTAAPDTPLLSSSSSSPPALPRLSLQSPELQAEFLQECRNKFRSHSDVRKSRVVSSATSPSSPPASTFSPSSPLPSPFSPSPFSSPCSSSSSSSSSCSENRRGQARLSLSSPELLSELKDSRTRSLRHVRAHNGLTTVFSGRGRGGRQVSGPAPSKRQANQKTSH